MFGTIPLAANSVERSSDLSDDSDDRELPVSKNIAESATNNAV